MIEKNKQDLILLKFFLITIIIIHKLVYKGFVLKFNDTTLKSYDIHYLMKKIEKKFKRIIWKIEKIKEQID